MQFISEKWCQFVDGNERRTHTCIHTYIHARIQVSQSIVMTRRVCEEVTKSAAYRHCHKRALLQLCSLNHTHTHLVEICRYVCRKQQHFSAPNSMQTFEQERKLTWKCNGEKLWELTWIPKPYVCGWDGVEIHEAEVPGNCYKNTHIFLHVCMLHAATNTELTRYTCSLQLGLHFSSARP